MKANMRRIGQNDWLELDENTYWEYVHNPAERARLENVWKHPGHKERRAG